MVLRETKVAPLETETRKGGSRGKREQNGREFLPQEGKRRPLEWFEEKGTAPGEKKFYHIEKEKGGGNGGK